MMPKKTLRDKSVEELYDLIKGHLTSLAEDEAKVRLEIIDKANVKARAQTRALETARFFADPRVRADFKAFDKMMKRRGGEPPRKGDELLRRKRARAQA